MNTQLTQAEINTMNEMNNDWMMDIPMEEAPVVTPTKKANKAGGLPSMTQVAQLTATTVTKSILDKYKVHPHKAAMAALAIIRTMYSINTEASYDVYLQAAADNAKYTNSKNNDKKAIHLKTDGVGILTMAETVHFLKIEEGVCTPTDKWNSMMVQSVPMSPSSAHISQVRGERLRSSIMKSKTKASATMQESVYFLEETEYSVHKPTLAFTQEVYALCQAKAEEVVMSGKSQVFKNSVQYRIQLRAQLNKFFPEELSMVIQGCNVVKDEESLWSEYDADARGRLYHVMCFGPNPQASDLARATYSLNTLVPVKVGTPAHELFLEELADIGGGKFNTHEARMAVAKSPVKALTKWFTTEGADAPSKPFTYTRMCQTYADFHNNGVATCTIGYGLDAKCSGTQYLAFVAGDMNMAEATGLTSSTLRAKDPYMQSLDFLYKSNPDYVALGLNRSFIKTPYMAVQYGGGVCALTDSKDFNSVLNALGITCAIKIEEIAEQCVEAIKLALGERINSFIQEAALAAKRKCKEMGKDFFQYKHTDGQLVKKPGYAKDNICGSFIIRIEEGEQLVFGGLDDNGKPTGDWTMTSKEMDMDEFARTFVVNYIQGLDALVARTFVKHAKAAGLRGVTSIHDCFRCILADAPKMKAVIASAYKEVFVDNNQLENLRKQLGKLDFYAENIVTEELLNHDNSYYFCI